VVCVTVGLLQLSVAVGVGQVAMAPHVLFCANVILTGQAVNVGGVWSTLQGFAVTTTLNAHVAVKLFASFAVYVMAVVPTGKQLPMLGCPAAWVMLGVLQLSVALGVSQTAIAPQALFWVTLIFAGQFVNIGGVWSTLQGFAVTMMLNAQAVVRLFPSLAV
jgi:hypothetical protein